MQDFSFDKDGNLSPYEIIDIDLKKFKERLVDNFSKSNTRMPIYIGYLQYCKDFCKDVASDGYQWVDGSFVTNKENPGDIDLVNFIKEEFIKTNYGRLQKYLGDYSKQKYKVHGFYMPIVPIEHKLYAIIQEHVNDCQKWFGFDREKKPKGILKIKLGDNHE